MSVFVLDDKDARGVFSALALDSAHSWAYALLTPEERRNGPECYPLGNLAEFVNAVREANLAAYCRRYRQSSEPSTPLALTRTHARPSMIETYKLLKCFRYNSDEAVNEDYGPVDAAHAVTVERLDQLIALLAQSIVERLPEYDTAAWGTL